MVQLKLITFIIIISNSLSTKDKLYDAFISYSNLDTDFVSEELIPELEHGIPQYKILEHSRDWAPGEQIASK
jgi:hypothetical protein